MFVSPNIEPTRVIGCVVGEEGGAGEGGIVCVARIGGVDETVSVSRAEHGALGG